MFATTVFQIQDDLFCQLAKGIVLYFKDFCKELSREALKRGNIFPDLQELLLRHKRVGVPKIQA